MSYSRYRLPNYSKQWWKRGYWIGDDGKQAIDGDNNQTGQQRC